MNPVYGGILLSVLTVILVGCAGSRERLQDDFGASYNAVFEEQRAKKSDGTQAATQGASGTTAEIIYGNYQERFRSGAEGLSGETTLKK